MKKHSPYQKHLNRPPDFIVEYELDLCEELKSSKPSQGMRVDFLYDGDDSQVEGINMIWPELLDESGVVIEDTTPDAMAPRGRANMWVVDETRRAYHATRIKVGVKGYWVRGSFRLANVVVTQVGSLDSLR